MPEANPQKVIQAYESLGGRSLQLSEVVSLLRKGRLKVSKVVYRKGDGYYVLVGGDEVPKEYDIVEVRPGLVVYRLGAGPRKAFKPKYATYFRVPAKAGPKEGPVIIEYLGDDLIAVYLG